MSRRQRLHIGAAPRRKLPSLRRWRWLVGALLFVALSLRLALLELVVVRGNTMAPVVLDGDVLLIKSRAEAKVGDVVLVEHEGRSVVRRVLATAGARITAIDGVLTVDEVPLETRVDGTFAYRDTGDEPRPLRQQRFVERLGEGPQHEILGDHVGAARPWLFELPDLEVPSGYVFVLCDNRRTCPLDERSGVVPIDWIDGVASRRAWTGGARLSGERVQGALGSTPPRK